MLMSTADRWSPDNRRQRLLAAVCAVVLTLFMGKQINSGRFHWPQHGLVNEAGTVSYLSLFSVAPRIRKAMPVIEPVNRWPLSAHASPAKSTATNTEPFSPTADTVNGAAPDALPLSPATTNIVHEEAGTFGSSTLKLDSTSIGKAYKDSRSDLQKRAESVGKTLEVQPKTQAQKFDTAMEEAAVPSCLASGEDPMKHNQPVVAGVQLAGLLALPFYAGAIIKGKCK
ncbi:hypothetical protein [Undibacterium sp.]|uniref:hypothetical protein n=1 Tax=Undibacterium sp. TaxID=1914977 RepID=UPI00374D742F